MSVLAPPRAAPTARDGQDGRGTSEVALVAEGGGEHALGDHTAAVRAHQLALRIVRVFHQLSGAAVGAAASARHLTTCPAPRKLSDRSPTTATVRKRQLTGELPKECTFLFRSARQH